MKLTQRRMSRPSLGGMMATRQGALILALVCAAAAAGVLMFALRSYKTNVAKPVVPQATVLVATGPIAMDTPGAQLEARGLVKATPILASQASPGAVSDAGELQGAYAATDIVAGQQITSADFTATPGVAGLLLPDQRAISLSISEAPGDNDVLVAGNQVDVYWLVGKSVVLLDPNITVIKTPTGVTGTTAATGSAGSTTTSTTASATTSTAAAATPSPAAKATGVLAGSSLVLNVTPQQASGLILAQSDGQLYLTLRPPKGTASPRTLTTVQSVLADSVASVNTQNGAKP